MQPLRLITLCHGSARFLAEARAALEGVRAAARDGRYLFAEFLEASKYCTLGALSKVLFEVGGAYRRNT